MARTGDGDRTTGVIRDHWDQRAPTFDEEEGHGLVGEEQRQAWQALLLRTVGPAHTDVLDVGCGTGFVALRLAELGHTVTGLDLAAEMINQAQRKAEAAGLGIRFRPGDAVDTGCPDSSFGLVIARHVIWNLPDPARGVAEWLRVLRPGGRLVLIEGKWADNEALQRELASPASRLRARGIDLAGGLLGRLRLPAAKLLSRRYSRVEAQLPFSGGPSAQRLADFLSDHSVEDARIEPLMDPVLWGKPPAFPRYLVEGRRSAGHSPTPG